MVKIDEKKLAKLTKGSEHRRQKYGLEGSESHREFEANAEVWY